MTHNELIALGIIAGIVGSVTWLLIHNFFGEKKDNAPTGTIAPFQSWYDTLAPAANLFSIITGVVGITTLINLAAVNTNNSYSVIHLTPQQSTQMNMAMAHAAPASPASFPSDLANNFFIQAQADGSNKLVYFTRDKNPDGTPGGLAIHLVNLDAKGVMSSPINPTASNVPFLVRVGGQVIVNPNISLPDITVTATAANTPQMGLSNQVAALRAGAALGHNVTIN